jgi:hypothetical protein
VSAETGFTKMSDRLAKERKETDSILSDALRLGIAYRCNRIIAGCHYVMTRIVRLRHSE